MDGTASTGNMQEVSLATMLKAMREIDLLPTPDQWIVIDPQGRMYKGTVQQVTSVLLAEHPLLKMPLTFGSTMEVSPNVKVTGAAPVGEASGSPQG